jgi:hypothetical protein
MQALVTICGQTIELKGLEPGASTTGQYRVTSDSHFSIDIIFKSGKKLHKDDGYVTNGVEYKHQIVVTESGITLTPLTIR